jgi:lipoprotein-anchoring transpeptidase ErfK/SrfK
MRLVAATTLALSLLIAGCDRAPVPAPTGVTSQPDPSSPADSMASNDGAAIGAADADPRPLMQAQVILDRLGFTPGVIDGKEGISTRNAVQGFQEANGLNPSGDLDAGTREKLAQWSDIPATRIVTIPADFAAGPFVALPRGEDEQAKLPALGYASLEEKLAERFHTTPATLQMLNPAGAPAAPGKQGQQAPQATANSAPANPPTGQPAPAQYRPGQQIRVPNVGNDAIDPAAIKAEPDWLKTMASLGVGTNQPKVDKIVVSKGKGTLRAYDEGGKLVAMYTVTTGSSHDPLPLGTWKVTAISRNPKFHYNPKLFWDASADDKAAMLPPGPNGPVGVVWIDLSKPHYGIHGTPVPETIGRTQSHGCVRLTNWDAARLSLMVHAGTEVLFEA